VTAATHILANGNGVVKTPTPVNLRERYGDRFRISYDEAYASEHGPNARIDDPWLQIIPGRLGHVYPLGGSMLAVSTNTRGPTANRLAKLPFCKVMLDGDDGMTLAFDANHFLEIAKLIRARTTRKANDAQRKSLAEHGAAYRFTSSAAKPRDTSDEAAS
jgi:hypothetical protein